MKENSSSLLEEWVTTRNYPAWTKNLEQFGHFTSSQTFSKYDVNKKLEHLTTWNKIQRSLRVPWYPSRPDKEKTLAAFFISQFLWCFKRFYEDLKGIHKTSWGTKKNCENNIDWNARDGKSWECVWTIAEVESSVDDEIMLLVSFNFTLKKFNFTLNYTFFKSTCIKVASKHLLWKNLYNSL